MRCRCNSMETDADCSNVLSENGSSCLNITEDILAAGKKSINLSKPIKIKRINESKSPNIEIRQQKIIITNLDSAAAAAAGNNRGVQCLNGNWILTQNKKPGWFSKKKDTRVYGTVSSLPDYDSTSHLSRGYNKCSNKPSMEPICECPINSTPKNLPKNLAFNDPANLYTEINPAKPNLFERNLSLQLAETNLTLSSSARQVSQMRGDLSKLVDLERISLDEKVIRNRWRIHARWFDRFCFFFVLTLLIACSLCIFFLFPLLNMTLVFD